MLAGGADYTVNEVGYRTMDSLSILNKAYNDNPDGAMRSFD